MTFPLIFHVAHYSVSFHLITDFISTSVGTWLYWKSAHDDGISTERRQYLLIGAGLGVLIGSRVLGALENPSLFIHPPALLYYYSSKTIIGGIAGGILGMELTKRIIGHVQSTGDKLTIPLLVAIAIGRVGCLFTGVTDGTVGNVCHYAWCFNQGDGLPRHPTSLYEILFLLILIPLLLHIKKKKLPEGVLFRLAIILYFGFRFFIECIKPINALVFSLSATQIVCLLYATWYAYDIIRILKKHPYGTRTT